MPPEILMHIYMYLFCRGVQVKKRHQHSMALQAPEMLKAQVQLKLSPQERLVTPGVSDILERVRCVCSLVLIRVHLGCEKSRSPEQLLKLPLYTCNKVMFSTSNASGKRFQGSYS